MKPTFALNLDSSYLNFKISGLPRLYYFLSSIHAFVHLSINHGDVLLRRLNQRPSWVLMYPTTHAFTVYCCFFLNIVLDYIFTLDTTTSAHRVYLKNKQGKKIHVTQGSMALVQKDKRFCQNFSNIFVEVWQPFWKLLIVYPLKVSNHLWCLRKELFKGELLFKSPYSDLSEPWSCMIGRSDARQKHISHTGWHKQPHAAIEI